MLLLTRIKFNWMDQKMPKVQMIFNITDLFAYMDLQNSQLYTEFPSL